MATAQAPQKGAARVLVRIVSCRVKLLDVDNLYGGAKPYVDALRYCGAIRDDSPGAIELRVEQEKVPSYHLEQTVIELYEL